MSKPKHITTHLEFTTTITLTEGQIRALDAMVGYGDDAFMKAFYIKLGRHYMQPFEKDLRELFDNIRENVIPAKREVDDMRRRLLEALKQQ